MINIKAYLKTLLNNDALKTKLGTKGKILASYPSEVTVFPCVIYQENGQNDIEFTDNLPEAVNVSVRVHIFTKTNSGYPTTSEVGNIVHNIFRNELWACTSNREMEEAEDNIRHRVMDFTREFYRSF